MSVKIALQALAIARSSEADEAVLAVYLHELADLDRGLVMLACERLAKLPRKEYQAALPDVGTIRAEATLVQVERHREAARRRLAPIPEEEDQRRYLHCHDCSDSGWRLFRCTGRTADRGQHDQDLTMIPCSRRQVHVPHTYAERCQCYDVNPMIFGRSTWGKKDGE